MALMRQCSRSPPECRRAAARKTLHTAGRCRAKHGARGLPSRDHRLAVRASLVELDCGAWVCVPTRHTRVRGLVHFVGGAFAGATPQVWYPLFCELLSERGYSVVATPYATTFQHLEAAGEVKKLFEVALAELRGSSAAWAAPANSACIGVGHSNGALLLLLAECLQQLGPGPAANVLISFNNKQVRDAIPIPGLLEGLGPGVRAVRDLPPVAPLPPASEVVSALAAAASRLPLTVVEPTLLARAERGLQQLGTLLEEVGNGTSDFTPSPTESRALVQEQYRVACTLLVRFADDSIDETVEMAGLLRNCVPWASQGGVEEVVLPGTHTTPCGSDVRWQVGVTFTPADAVLQAVKAAGQGEVRALVKRVADFLDDVVLAPAPEVAVGPGSAIITA